MVVWGEIWTEEDEGGRFEKEVDEEEAALCAGEWGKGWRSLSLDGVAAGLSAIVG